MIPYLKEAWHIRDYTLGLRFSDGITGEIDFQSELYGEIFEPLKDPATFARFRVDPELRTLTWPNGADFAPEFLYGCVAQSVVS